VARWCAEAGRQAGSAEIRRALEPLGWDELLSVRALLADPPPARPLGPGALADMARGAPPDLAAEREREGRYRSEVDDLPVAEAPATPTPAAPKGAPRRARAKRPGVVIRRARDVAPAPRAQAAALPLVDELYLPEGRGVLERLVRTHGGRRSSLAAALASGWRRADGTAPGDEALAALLDHHGLARAFEHRERDELLHALRAAGGIRAQAAARLGIDPGALDGALARLGATGEAERIRERRRADLRARATLAERVRLLLTDEARLRDLDLLQELEDDLRTRLPEHVRALRAAPGPVGLALARSLSVAPGEARALAARLGVELDSRPPPARGAGARQGGRGRPERGPVTERAPGPARRERPARPASDSGARAVRPSRPAPQPGARAARPSLPDRRGGKAPGGAEAPSSRPPGRRPPRSGGPTTDRRRPPGGRRRG
jgi:hypothetical protein